MLLNTLILGFPGSPVLKNLPGNAGDAIDIGSIPGSGRSPGEGNDNPFQYSCLEIPRTEEPGRHSTVHGLPGVRHDLATEQ